MGRKFGEGVAEKLGIQIDKVVQGLNKYALEAKGKNTLPDAQAHLNGAFGITEAKDVADLLKNKQRQSAFADVAE